MFYLEIQPSKIPGCHATLRCKIGGCFNLMNRPFVINTARVGIRAREGIAFQRMRQLKDDRECKSHHQMNYDKGDEYVQERMKEERQADHIAEVEHLGQEEQRDFSSRSPAQLVCADAPREELLEITIGYPRQRQQAVEGKGVYVLKAMPRSPVLIGA